MLIFVEVKARSSNEFGYPSEFVNTKKQNNIKRCAEYFLIKNNIDDIYLRFDVIAVSGSKDIEWIENAF